MNSGIDRTGNVVGTADGGAKRILPFPLSCLCSLLLKRTLGRISDLGRADSACR